MIIRNRLAALIYRSIALALSIAILFYHFHASGSFAPHLYNYFYVISGLYTSIIFALMVIFNAIDMRRGLFGIAASVYPPVSLTVTCLSFVTILGNLCYLLPLGIMGTSLDYLFINFLLPLLAIANWLMFEEKGTVKFEAIILWLIGPMVYIVLEIIRGATWGQAIFGSSKYPYPFFDFDLNGVWQTWLQLAIVTIIFIVIAFITVFLNNLVSGKYKKHHDSK